MKMDTRQRMLGKRTFWSLGALGFLAVFLGGCGGGSNPSGSGQGGDLPFRSAAIASDQALNGGLGYPFAMLQATTPTNSGITRSAAFARPGTLAAQLISSSPAATIRGTRAGGISFNALLNLYALEPVVTGNTQVTQFYKDPAGTQPAGSITLAEQGVATFTKNIPLAAYPATVTGTFNLTAGTVPCTGNVTIVYAVNVTPGKFPTGANTMTGHLDLTRTGIGIDLNLALSDALNVSGSTVIHENGQAISVTAINGPLFSRIPGKVNIAPLGWAGLCNFSLKDSTFTLTVNSGSGTDVAGTDATGNLNVAYAGGQTETIYQPLLAALTGAIGSNPPGSGGGPVVKSFFGAPIAVGQITGINASGQMVGKQGYYASPTAAPIALPAPSGNTVSPTGINASGQIIGFTTPAESDPVGGSPLFWPSPTSPPVVLPVLTAGALTRVWAINSSGQMFGMSETASRVITPIYWANPTSTPLPLTTAAFNDPSGSPFGTYDPARAFFIADDGTLLVLSGIAQFADSAVFKAPASASGSIQGPIRLTPLSPGDFVIADALSAQGKIAGISGETHRVLFANSSAAPTSLADFGSVWQRDMASINDSGSVVGTILGGTNPPVLWRDGKALNINTLLPAGTTISLSSLMRYADE
ncbi:MAG: hypothetical protein JWN14_1229, partial [Chthonomonadales bacterium]|nr:hypothetical protein [Chthonomonadales bacterium]